MMLIDISGVRGRGGEQAVCASLGVEGRRLEKDFEETGIAEGERIGIEDALAYCSDSCRYCSPVLSASVLFCRKKGRFGR